MVLARFRPRVLIMSGVVLVVGLAAVGYAVSANRLGNGQLRPDGRVHREPVDRSRFTSFKDGEIKHALNSDPEHLPASDAPLEDWDIVLGAVINGRAVAYPVNYMGGPDNEIVNDTVAGRPITASW